MRLILLLLIFLISCSQKDPIYTKEELYQLAKKSDPNIQLVLPGKIDEVIPCSDYGEGCISAHRLLVKELEFIAIEFDSHQNAVKSAKAIRAWVVRNWLFDDVTGEPVLEKFIKEALDAKPVFLPSEVK